LLAEGVKLGYSGFQRFNTEKGYPLCVMMPEPESTLVKLIELSPLPLYPIWYHSCQKDEFAPHNTGFHFIAGPSHMKGFNGIPTENRAL
jgi:hypothetical protein